MSSFVRFSGRRRNPVASRIVTIGFATLVSGAALSAYAQPSGAFADAFARMQALSSDAPAWQIDRGGSDLDLGPTFAQMHPHGLPFAQYQAYATNSSEFALPSDGSGKTMTASERAAGNKTARESI